MKNANIKKLTDTLYATIDAAIGAKAGLDPRKSAQEGLMYSVLNDAEFTARRLASTLENIAER